MFEDTVTIFLPSNDTGLSPSAVNDTSNPTFEEFIADAEIISGFFYLACALIGTPANLYTIRQLKTRRMVSWIRKTPEVTKLLLNLAAADLFVCAIHCVTEAIWTFTNMWYGGEFLCRFLMFFKSFGCQVSGITENDLTLLTIGLRRQVTSLRPLRTTGTVQSRIH